MIHSKKALIAALLFPIIALAVLTGYKKSVLSYGTEVTLPISGYDPRDLLSGHYLIYQIDYGVSGICPDNSPHDAGFICLETKTFSYVEPESCAQLIRGVCHYSRFEAGIEKYFVPEDKAKELEDRIRSKSASIVLSIPKSGHAQVKELLVEGQPWDKK